MGKHWVRAIKILQRLTLEGGRRTYHPGDWFQVRNREMRGLLERGMIRTTPQILRAEYNVKNAGVLLRAGAIKPPDLKPYALAHKEASELTLPWERTIILGEGTAVTTASLVIGLSRVEDRWEMAVLLEDMHKLARDIGSDEEREKTLEIIGDLRLPVYDTSVLWLRRTEAVEEWLDAWRTELEEGADEQHAFLRTLYTRRLKLCTLPTDWVGRWHEA